MYMKSARSSVFTSSCTPWLQGADFNKAFFDGKISALLQSFSGLRFIVTVSVSGRILTTRLRNVQFLIQDLLEALNEIEQVECLVLDVHITENSIFINMNHDKVGLKRQDLQPCQNSRIRHDHRASIDERCDLLNVMIELNVGSIYVHSE